MILLTDEEIQRTTYFSVSTEIYDRKEVELGREFFIKGALFGSKAQLKKVVEWLNTLEFHEDWGGEQAKLCRDHIVQALLKEEK